MSPRTYTSSDRRTATITLPDDIRDWLRDYAARTGEPGSHVIERLLRAEKARVEAPPETPDDELLRLRNCVGDIEALSGDALLGGVGKEFALSRIHYLADAMLPGEGEG
jgi:hypothetical protein